MNGSKIILKLARKAVFFLTFIVGVTAVDVFPQDNTETIDAAKTFSEAFRNADAEKMEILLADDFQYFTNVACAYKDCDKGAKKEDYIKGVVEERRTKEFAVQTVKMKYLKPIINSNAAPGDRAVSFYCEVTMSAKGKTHKFYSFINYYLRKDENGWKIVKIENQIV